MSQNCVIYTDRKKVFTLNSKLFIPSKRFKDALNTIKHLYGSEDIQKANSLFTALEIIGWQSRGNSEGITKLIYNDDHWTVKTNCVIDRLAKFIEDGGYIRMYSQVTNSAWVLKFQNGKMLRVNLEQNFLDFSSRDDMEKMFMASLGSLFQLGLSYEEVQKITEEMYIAYLCGTKLRNINDKS